MKKIYQTKLHNPPDEKGNCLAACLASILEMDIEKIPDFNGENWFPQMTKWLYSIGYDLLSWKFEYPEWINAYTICSGKSPRGEFWHSVIYKNGVLHHDPHPSGAGIEDLKEIWAILPHELLRATKYPTSGCPILKGEN